MMEDISAAVRLLKLAVACDNADKAKAAKASELKSYLKLYNLPYNFNKNELIEK